MKTIEAIQVQAELQGQYAVDEIPDDIVIMGNKDFKGVTSSLFMDVDEFLDDCMEHGCDNEGILDNVQYYFHNYAENWTDEQKQAFCKLVNKVYEKDEYYDEICGIMQLVSGEEFRHGTIRGCCQSEWQEIIYPVSMEEEIKRIEALYFNTGTEWQFDKDDEITDFHYSQYHPAYDAEKIKAEIKAYFNEEVEVELRRITGYVTEPIYEAV